MENDNGQDLPRRRQSKKPYFVIAGLVLVALLIGIGIGYSHQEDKSSTTTTANTAKKQTTGSFVKDLITYTLPDGWQEASCDTNSKSIYIVPDDTVDCGATSTVPVILSLDPANTKDCNQLQNEQNIKKHICISLFINGHKSLKSSTEYLPSSSYKKETTLNAYYIDTGKGVVKAVYMFNSDNSFQAGFDALANSINTK